MIINFEMPWTSGIAKKMLQNGKKVMQDPINGGIVIRHKNRFFELLVSSATGISGQSIPIIYLVTIAIPVSEDSEFTEYTDYDIDGLHVCKSYAYTIDESSGILIPNPMDIILRHNDFTVGGGLTLTLQEGYLSGPDHYATLSNQFSQEEEIGSINWRAFQAGGGYSLSNPGEPDTNTYWGFGIVRFMKWALYGSALGLEHPDPTTIMNNSYAARKGYVLDGNNVKYNDLVYTREVINSQFAPSYWYDYLPGMAYFHGIVEYLNPNYRWVFKHKIGALDIATNTNKYTVIAEDEHELQNYPTQSAIETSSNWKYHVPIMLVSDTEALMRIVKRVGTSKTCWEADLTEELVIGQSESNLNLDTITVHSTGGITTTSVSGSATIGANDSKGYILDGCNQGDVLWEVSGTGATISQAGQLTTSGGCGIIVVTGTCVSCGVSAQKTVIAPGVWKDIGTCSRTPGYCFGASEWITVTTATHYWQCVNAICPGAVDCNAAWTCTGSCTVGSCSKCLGTGQLNTTGIFCKVHGCP